MENTANDDLLQTLAIEDDVLAVDELMGPAFIEPAHTRIVAEQLKHRVEFAQLLFGLSVAEVFEGVSVNVFQIAFGAMRYPMAHAGVRHALPE
ncbi:hypothetical protein [Mesorhizobium sp. WSM1497]|uniref:hypothetical protein n=1 Tax=Mesorhizobium sp. WSM1497 TaxID=278153 RepID=UPI001FD8898D|nr:hypothetical protein [Mesorhizobium sp. WSM1497]